jgi:hypothetical protein
MSAIAPILATTICGLPTSSGVKVQTSSDTVGINKTYAPEGAVKATPGVFRWVDRSGGIPIAYPSYTIRVRAPSQGDPNFRVDEKISLPIPNITSPSTGSGIQPLPSVGYEYVANRGYKLPQAGTAAERLVFHSLCSSFSADVIISSDAVPLDSTGSPLRAAIIDLDGPYF